MKEFIKNNYQKIFNIYLFVNFFAWAIWQAYSYYVEDALGYVEIGFIAQNLIVAIFLLVRLDFKTIEKNYISQTVALLAFFSGAAFMGQEATGNESTELVSSIIIAVSHVLGLITILNLGKSFGILIAFRKVKTGGLYRIVRHPMYFTDILLRIGFLVSHFNLFVLAVFIVSTGLYVYRAILEEKHLRLQPEYREYMKIVKYRLIPFVF